MRRATSVWFDENSIGGRDPGDRIIHKSTEMNLDNHLVLDRNTEQREIDSVNNRLLSSQPTHASTMDVQRLLMAPRLDDGRDTTMVADAAGPSVSVPVVPVNRSQGTGESEVGSEQQPTAGHGTNPKESQIRVST